MKKELKIIIITFIIAIISIVFNVISIINISEIRTENINKEKDIIDICRYIKEESTIQNENIKNLFSNDSLMKELFIDIYQKIN